MIVSLYWICCLLFSKLFNFLCSYFFLHTSNVSDPFVVMWWRGIRRCLCWGLPFNVFNCSGTFLLTFLHKFTQFVWQVLMIDLCSFLISDCSLKIIIKMGVLAWSSVLFKISINWKLCAPINIRSLDLQVLKFLMEKNSINTLYGQVTVGTLILQVCLESWLSLCWYVINNIMHLSLSLSY